ncbi:MAG: aldehyde dehydrogenase EutE [Deltaproteobacteria bacterium HGW-Deltaproteobacteria-14]|nr:MAG: aldehyde dehydrogenase EutE [Deltaproteobacteria bacterium HGW-Deltaproteobacteria-14]
MPPTIPPTVSRGPFPRQPQAASGPMCAPTPPHAPRPAGGGGGSAQGAFGEGVFEHLDQAMDAAVKAFYAFGDLGLGKRKVIIEALRAALRVDSDRLAREAHEETGLGRVEDKIQKNKLVIEKTPGPEILVAQAISGDAGLMLLEPAPFGVIGAITPVTNPTSTIICNAIGMLSAGNSVVFNVHPSAKKVSAETVRIINRAVISAGGPPNTVTCIAEPTIESANALMTHKKTRIVVVTGGPGVVNAAMVSGKRAICGGPGNPPVVVDETADIEQAAKRIVYGHSFDNNIICVDEKECIVVDAVADDLKKAMTRNGAVELPARDLARLEKVIFSKNAGPRGHATVNKDFVGKNASVILKELGVHAGPEVRCVIIEVPNDHPLVWTEQMMPVLPITRARNVDAAIDLAVEAEGHNFHTAMMHSHDIRALSRMARASNCSIFSKNGTGVDGLAHNGEGYTSFTIASPTGEGLTTAREFSRWRRCTMRDHFRIV